MSKTFLKLRKFEKKVFKQVTSSKILEKSILSVLLLPLVEEKDWVERWEIGEWEGGVMGVWHMVA